MKNTKTPKKSALRLIFESVSALFIIAVSGYCFAVGFTFFAVWFMSMGFFTRWAVCEMAEDDNRYNQWIEENERIANYLKTK